MSFCSLQKCGVYVCMCVCVCVCVCLFACVFGKWSREEQGRVIRNPSEILHMAT